MTGSTIVVALPGTDGAHITGAVVVARDEKGRPTMVRTPDGVEHTTFTVL